MLSLPTKLHQPDTIFEALLSLTESDSDIEFLSSRMFSFASLRLKVEYVRLGHVSNSYSKQLRGACHERNR